MLVLGLETSTTQLGIALCRDQRLIAEFTLAEGQKHCERLVVGLDGLLADLGLAVAAIEGIAVSVGPGSFTGLRIGVAAAQGLGSALGVPVVGVPSLDALVAPAADWRGAILGCLDARRGEVYFCCYRSAPAGVERVTSPGAAAPDAVPRRVPFACEEPLLLVGDGGDRVAPALEEAGHAVREATGLDRYPRAGHLARLGARAFAAGAGQRPEDVQPLYLRRSDAELTRERFILADGA